MKKLLVTIPFFGCAYAFTPKKLSQITYAKNNASSNHTLRLALNGVMNERDELLEDAIGIINESNDYCKIMLAKKEYSNFKNLLQKLNLEMSLLEAPLRDILDCDDQDIDDKLEIYKQKLIEYDRLHERAIRVFGYVSDTVRNLITELPPDYKRFKNPDMYRKASQYYLDASCRLMMMNKISKIITDRSNECGTASKREPFYDYSIDEINGLLDSAERSLSGAPIEIRGSSDIRKIREICDSIERNYESAIAVLELFSTSLVKKYKDEGVTVQPVPISDILSKLKGIPGISGFSMPFLLSTIAFIFVNLYF